MNRDCNQESTAGSLFFLSKFLCCPCILFLHLWHYHIYLLCIFPLQVFYLLPKVLLCPWTSMFLLSKFLPFFCLKFPHILMYQVRKGCLGLSCSLACPKMQNFTQFLLHWALVSQKMTTSLSISTQTHPFPFPDPSHPAPQGPQVLKPPHILGSSPRKVFLSPGSVWVLILWPAGSPHHWKTRVFSFLLWPLSGPLWSRALLCPQFLALPSCPLSCCLHEGQKEELPLPCFSQPFSHSPHSGCHPRFLCSDASCLSDHLPHPSC